MDDATQHHHMTQHHHHHQLPKDLSHHLQQPSSAHHRSSNAGPQSASSSSTSSSSSSAHHVKLLQQQQQQQQQSPSSNQQQHSSSSNSSFNILHRGIRDPVPAERYVPLVPVGEHRTAIATISNHSRCHRRGHSAQRYSTELQHQAVDHRQQSHHHHQRPSMSPAMGVTGDSRSALSGSASSSMAGGLGSAGMLIDRSGSTDRFGALEDPLSTSCLQPPSPAPSNDHYNVMGLPAPAPTSASHHYSDRHYGTIQRRTASPSNIRYRHSLTESYRDMSPQCDRYIPPPAHFLAGSSALAAADTYGYLGANVHTPIKRYVPTPPPQEPTYQPLPGTASSSAKTQALMSALLGQGVSLGNGGVGGSSSTSQRNVAPAHHAQYAYATSTLPYGFRVKTNNNTIGSEHTISPPKGFETPDHYNSGTGSSGNNAVTASNNGNHNAPPARVRPPKCPSSLVAVPNATSTLPHPASHGSRSNSSSRYSQPTMVPSSITSSISSCGSGTSSGNNGTGSSMYRMSRTSSAEFLDQPRGLYRVSTPVSVMSEPNGTSSGSASCLHCNTLRRTTGVHQTTQTTGPISPQPVNHPQDLSNGSCHSVPISPASLTSPQQANGMLSLVQSTVHGHSASQQQPHSVSSPYLQHPQHQLHHSQSHMIQSSTGKTVIAAATVAAAAAAAAAQSSHSQTYDNLHDRTQLDGRDIATIPRNGSKHQFVQSGGAGGARAGATEAPSMESIISASSSSRSMLIPQQQHLYSNTSIPPQPTPSNVQQQQLPPQQTITNPASASAQQSQQATAQQQSVPPLQLIANTTNSSSSSPQQQQQQQQQQQPHSQLTLEAQHASSTASIAQQQPSQQQQSPQPMAQPTLAPVPVPVSMAQPTIASPAIVPYVPAAPPLVAAPHSMPHLQHGPASLNDSPASTLQRSSNAQLLRIPQSNLSCKQRIKEYVRRETAKFFGVLPGQQDEEYERSKWDDRQRRFACRRFGTLRDDHDELGAGNGGQRGGAGHDGAGGIGAGGGIGGANGHGVGPLAPSDRPDILPAQSQDERETELSRRQRANPHFGSMGSHHDPPAGADGADVYLIRAERKPSVPAVIYGGLSFLVQSITRHRLRTHKQWSRSFAPAHVELTGSDGSDGHCDGLAPIPDGEAFFDTPTAPGAIAGPGAAAGVGAAHDNNSRQLYVSDGDRTTGSGIINGWRTKSAELHQQQIQHNNQQQDPAAGNGVYGQRISSNILDGVLDNSVRPVRNRVKLLRPNLLDERYDYRPFFTYWINTVQIVVMVLSLICYGFGPIGIGMEYRSAQVLVTSLSLQQVHHQEPRNIWIGLRSADLIHLGAKYGACMRRDAKIMDVVSRTRKHERETACCIRNDDSGCVQSSQADCSIRGWPSKTIATWKKWSPGESGPGGRISGSVCGLDPKYCDAPASIAPHEWPDDITKWPICRKNNQLSQRFRFKDHTAEHMVCEVIGHPCCIGVYGECRITTREYCDFVNGYFHEEASLCSQVSCLNDVCGMFHFMATDYPDQFYRLFTSLCLHAGLLHLLVSVAFQHVLLADLERLIGPLRTAILYIGSGIAGNLTSAIFVPYKAEVGPLPSIAGVLASLMLQLVLCHWKSLKKPHIAMIKLLILGCTLFGLGTLPLQQNFTGLIAGLLTGIALTLAFVPFVNVTKHSRKSKINLIWTCVTLQFVLYATMFIIFYAFPTLFESLNFIDGNQLMDPNAGHGYHDHYSLYDGYNNYNPLGPSSGSGHNSAGGHGHGNAGGPVGGGGGSSNNGKIGTYNNNQNIYKTSGGNVMHNHHDYTGGGGGGNVISMSGGGSSSGRNGGSAGRPAIGNNLLKTISLCEKGQCVSLRQPRQHADTNA
ncbi:rhomboid [Anopheles darlingi]|uniref:Rhomboid n=1 Tax=Anopheles darlingi TaxID=43151 RepID=W5J467_ANODA|nr:rhomboid [Anopheles darlingi]